MKNRYGMPLLFGMILTSGCALTPAAPSPTEMTAGQGSGYVSRLEDPEARALFHYSRFTLLAGEGKSEEALAALLEAIRLDPENEALRFDLADYYLELGQEKQAVRTIEDVLIRNPASVGAHLRLGNAYLTTRRPALAVPHYRRILDIQPDNEQVGLQLVVALVRAGEPGQAVDEAKKLLERRPDSKLGRLALARLYRETGLEVLAIEQYQLILAQDPDLTQAALELGLLFEERREWNDALKVFRAALARDPEEFSLRRHLARVYVGMKRYTDALAELQIVTAADPDDVDARRKIGLIYLEQEKWDKAIAEFRGILADRPELEAVRYYLGMALSRKESWPAAYEEFRQIGEDSPFYDDALGHMSYIKAQTGHMDEAIELLSARLQRPDPRPQQFYYLAVLYAGSGKDARAVEVLDRGLQLFPGNSEMLFEKGTALERLGRQEAALAVMKQVVAADPDHAEALNYVAYNLAEAGRDLEEALKLAQRAVAVKPAGHIQDTLGWIYYRLGRYDEARKALEAAVKLIPDDAVILEHLGDVLAQFDWDEAVAVYRRALELDPAQEGVRTKLKDLEGEP